MQSVSGGSAQLQIAVPAGQAGVPGLRSARRQRRPTIAAFFFAEIKR
jgi:hypothetical protein